MLSIKLKSSITLMLCCLLVGVTYASTKLPNHYPSHIKIAGKITNIFKQTKEIELDGTSYVLHPLHDIYTKTKGRQATLYDLSPGMKVGLELTTFKGKKTYQGKKVVNKVWILPKDYPSTKHTH